jgi:hypothetical protein
MRHAAAAVAGVSALLVLLTLIAAYVAWRSDWAAQGLAGQSQTGSFLAGLGGLLGLLFAFAMLLQGTASLVMTGCER